MIKLKLSFGPGQDNKSFDIVNDELLSDAVDRALADVPGTFDKNEAFNVVVNGHIIESDFWKFTKLKESDNITISPRIGKGDSGQIFKQALILAITVIASYYLGPAGAGLTGVQLGLAVGAVTIGATLLMNAMIPPPVLDLGPGNRGGVEDSQMYAITGQSNQMRRLGIVPKVYGSHRIFPNVAATPYTELSVDPDTGELVQYLYAIYDFGLGTPRLSEIKIGDTPLTTDSFESFDYRMVDPMRPDIAADDFDEPLAQEFKYYKLRRVITPLSFALTDGSEFVQFADANTDGLPQEIILDFVAPRGLFGISSQGERGERVVRMEIEFALVGTDDWHDYNDMDFVDTYSAIGGDDLTGFRSAQLATDGTSGLDQPGDYYFFMNHQFVSYSYGGDNAVVAAYIIPNQDKLLVIDSEFYNVGAKIFFGDTYLGRIAEINILGGGKTELTLEEKIIEKTGAQWFEAYSFRGQEVFGGSPIFPPIGDVAAPIRISDHESGSAQMTGSSTNAVYGNFRFSPKVTGSYKVRVKRASTVAEEGFSTQVGDNLTWGAITTAYKLSPVNSTKRHVYLELKIKATDQLNGTIQNLSAVASSVLPVYDPDTGIWTREVTNNPAWVFCDLLTGEVNKKAVSTSRLHMDSIVEWSEYCNTVPDSPPSADFAEPRFQCNFILDYESTLQTVLGQVGSSAQASMNIIDGKYGVLIDRYKDTPVQIFTPRNSRDFSSTRMYGPRPHAVKVKYIDPNLDWEISETVVYDNGYTALNAIDIDELSSFACTNHEQAWRFGRYMIAQNKLRQETISILVDFENLVCTRGDYVQITQDVMQVGGTPARVKEFLADVITIDDSLDIDIDLSYGYVFRSVTGEILTSTLTPLTASTFQLDGEIPAIGDLVVIGEVGNLVYDCIVKSINPNDDMSATITLVEKADAIYEYESTDTLPDYDPQLSNTSRPDFKPPKAVVGLVVADNLWECSSTKSGYNYYVSLAWDIPPGSVYEFFEIWVKDGRGYKAVGKTTNKIYKYDVEQDRLDMEHGFKVVAVSASGKKLQLIEMPEVFATPLEKTDPPSDVTSLNMSITNQVLQLSWTKIDDCDCASYEIRFSPDTNDVWESSISVAKVSRDVNSVSVQARTGVYHLKAFDFVGNQSANSANALTTIPNLFDLNVIDTINDAPTFDGTLDRTEVLGEAVILQEEVVGDPNTVDYYDEGYFESNTLLDLGDVYTVRLQSQIRADGYRLGELMSDWDELDDIDHLNTATTDLWDVEPQYRTTDVFAAMADWVSLSVIDHISYGAGAGFTPWRPIPTIGDATGRVFQFRYLLKSFFANVTPRLFDGSIRADMPDRTDSFEDQTSLIGEGYVITYDEVFNGPGSSPNVQVSIDSAQSGDYWAFDYKTLEGLSIRFYNNANVQVVRQFDLVAKGYGRRHTSTI